MRANLNPDTELAERLFADLQMATASPSGRGVTRDAYGPGEEKAHAIVIKAAERLGLEIAHDQARNLLMTLPGRDRTAKRIILGSHLDSVWEGGNFDGAAGVLAGLAAVAGMRKADFVPEFDISVLAIRSEEAGSWFPTSYPGSRAAIGRLPAEALQVRRQDTGRTLADHMRDVGGNPEAVAAGQTLLPPETIDCYVEVHIEQGPVLDALSVPVGIVTGIPGARRLRTGRVLGAYNHSGATPRRYRADAAMALAELAFRLDETWARLESQGHALVCTFCVLGTTPEAGFTKIPGEAVFQLDIRSVDPRSTAAMFVELHRLMAEIASRRGVIFAPGPETVSAPSPMDKTLQEALARAAKALGIRCHAMASGGGHDAAAFAQVGIPSAMLFVRNQNGSHNPDEAMRMEDFAAVTAVLTRFVADRTA